MRTLPALATALGVAIAAPLIAQQPMPIPGTADASRVTAGTYTMDSAHTLIGWRVNHLGFNDYFGIFGNPTGTLTLDPANPAAAKLSVQVPISGLVVASDKLSEHLMSGDFFNAATHPTASFVSTGVTVDGEDAQISGDLTLNGVTKPVTISARFTGAGANPMSKAETIGFEGKTVIKRSDFGISYGVPAASDEVALGITAAFEKR